MIGQNLPFVEDHSRSEDLANRTSKDQWHWLCRWKAQRRRLIGVRHKEYSTISTQRIDSHGNEHLSDHNSLHSLCCIVSVDAQILFFGGKDKCKLLQTLASVTWSRVLWQGWEDRSFVCNFWEVKALVLQRISRTSSTHFTNSRWQLTRPSNTTYINRIIHSTYTTMPLTALERSQ